MLALGFQLHFGINSAPLFLRFAKPSDLDLLMPVFWIGFNIAMLPASLFTRRFGGLVVMGAAALTGAFAVVAAEFAARLDLVVVGAIYCRRRLGRDSASAAAAALAVGDSGAEGRAHRCCSRRSRWRRSSAWRRLPAGLGRSGGRTAAAMGADPMLGGWRRGPAVSLRRPFGGRARPRPRAAEDVTRPWAAWCEADSASPSASFAPKFPRRLPHRVGKIPWHRLSSLCCLSL